MDDSLRKLQAEVVAFRDERDWAQFHRPKDLVLGLVAEAGELAEVFLWRPEEELRDLKRDDALRSRLGEELADVLVYLLYLADAAGLDLAAATRAKLAQNASKYPVEKAKGTARKYTDL
jgi:NTP pyrophosphatase (non-canonical NTP hydrolase)